MGGGGPTIWLRRGVCELALQIHHGFIIHREFLKVAACVVREFTPIRATALLSHQLGSDVVYSVHDVIDIYIKSTLTL